MVKRITETFSDLAHKPRMQYLLLGLITLVAAVVRLYRLDDWSFWVDEIFTNQRAADVFSRDLVYGLLNHSISLKLGGLLGLVLPPDEFGSRLVPALIGILSVPLLFFPVRRIFGAPVALLAVLLLAVAPWHVYWSQNARFYTAQLLFYTLSLLYFYIGLEERRRSLLGLAMLLFVLSVWERLTSAFAIPVALAYLFIAYVPLSGASWRDGYRVASRYAAPVLVLPLLLGAYDIFGRPYFGNSSMIFSFVDIFVGHTNNSPLRLSMAIAYRIGLPIVCLSLVGAVILLLSDRSRRTWFLLLATFVPLFGLLFLSLFSFAVDRYLFASLPFWFILCAVALYGLFTRLEQSGRLLAVGVLAFVLADSASSNLLYFQYQHGNRVDLRSAFSYVAERKSPGAIVATTNNSLMVGEHYLGDGAVMPFDDLDLEAIERSGAPAWFVYETDVGWTPPAVEAWLNDKADLVRVSDIYLPGKPVRLRVYSFGER